MLELGHDRLDVEQMLGQLKCGIELPADWHNFFDVRGPLSPAANEHRTFPRFHYRGRAVLGCRQSLPLLPRDEGLFCIYTKDVSRAGIAFLHGEQLFPREVARIWLPGGTARDVMVTRCVRIAMRFFEIGARFTHLGEPDQIGE